MSTIRGGSIIENLGALGIVKSPDARVFIVDPSDTGFTLQDAIDECIADQGDIIVCLPGSHDVSSTVNFNKKGVTVVAAALGHPDPAKGESFMINAASGFSDAPVATFTQPARIIGMGFAGRDTTQESVLIDSGEAGGFNGGFISFENCRFPCWYGAMDALVRIQGGSLNYFDGCTFDGLFVGVGNAAIVCEDSGAVTCDFLRVKNCEFSGVGSGKHAIEHATGGTPLDVLYAHNYLTPGFQGNQGKFLDNVSVASTGMIADNWVAPLANQGAAFENMTNSSIGFADNHYEEA